MQTGAPFKHFWKLAMLAAVALVLAGWPAPALAQKVTAEEDTNISSQLQALVTLASSLHYESNDIALKNGLAKISLPTGFRYLSPADAQTVIVKMWGNPPGPETLGMIVPADLSILSPASWAVVITYDNDGYVKDADAGKINYTDLLHQMQEATREGSKARVEKGYPAIDLVGWAAPPVYDQATHKMYWAKEIRFGDSTRNTLNYNIRVLGRHGVLVLNAVATMDQFSEIQQQTPDIVKMVDFTSGNRYADFNGSTDKVAAYGLAALVLGGIAAKAGFFKLLLVGILAAKKFIIIGVIACWSFIKKLFNRKPPTPPNPTPAV